MTVDSPVASSVATEVPATSSGAAEVPATSSGAAEVYTPLSSRTTAASFSQMIPVLQHGRVEHNTDSHAVKLDHACTHYFNNSR